MRGNARITVFLLALGISGWNCGNVGPVVQPLASEFDVGLGEIGLLSGTFFFGGIVAATLVASALAPRIPVVTGIRAACALAAAGNLIVAASPVFAGLVGGRVIAGLGVGLSFLYVPAFARAVGGVKLLGVFGAGLTLGIASALALGSVMEEAGIDWRWAFALTAALSVVALPMLPREVVIERAPHTDDEGIWPRSLTSGAWWRVELLGLTALSIPLVIGAWLVHYLTAGDGVSTATAGAMAFGLFGVSALMRDVAGRMAASGVPHLALVVGGLGLGAAGLLLLGQDRTLPAAAGSIVLIGIGLSLPYPLFYDEAERVFPDRPIGGLGTLMVGLNVVPMLVVPLFGLALASGDADLAFACLAVFALASAALNARPAVGSTAPPG